jgi:zinc protease
MKKAFKIILPGFCLAFFFFSFSGDENKAKLVEKVTKKGSEVIIPYERYVLPNGLNLIIHEDHSDPIVHVDVTYHVGSAREQEGRSGFAHFFEHMMFQGSDHVADEEHFKVVSEAGGTLNGSTTLDRTNYFETLPSNQLEKALWLESDRMGFLLDAVTQQKFEVQRGTVKNERGQNYDNRPYGLVNERVVAALYPLGHPYSWPTIGYIEDLNRVDVNDLKKFFMRWYGPNNAVLTVAGDVKPEQVIQLVEKYFGPIPRGPEVKIMPKQPAVLDKDRYISLEDRIRFPMLSITWPGVCAGSPDEVPMDALAQILGGDKNSIFYQKFIKSQVARGANVFNPTAELSGDFRVMITAFPGKTLAQIDSMVKAAFVEFEQKGVSDDDIKKYQNTNEAELINSLSSVNGKAAQLAHNFTYYQDANFIRKTVAAEEKLTKEDVKRVYEKYIKGKPAVYMSVYPVGKPELVAKPDNYTPPKRRTDVPEGAEYKNLVYNKAKDTFDRNIKPPSGPNPVITVPDYWQEKFPNGLKVIGVKNDEVPSVTLMVSVEAGHRQEAPEKAGVANICAHLLEESTTKHTAEEIDAQLDRLGSTISFNSGRDEISMSVTSLTKNLAQTMKIAEEMFTSPKFDQQEFETYKKQVLESIANNVNQPTAIAENVYAKLLYGSNSILAIPSSGNEQTVKSITLDDVKDYYAKHFSPSISELVVVGDVDKTTILSQVGFLKNWAKKDVVLKSEASSRPPDGKTKIYLVNKDKAAQSEIRMGDATGLTYDATGEYFKAGVMNFVLGGAFNSRINLDLREKRAFTYGAGSGFNSDKYAGTFTIRAPVRTNSTDSSLIDILEQVHLYNEKGITPDELNFTKNSMGQSDARKYETNAQKAGFLKRILDYDLDKGYVKKQTEILNSVTKEQIDGLAKKYVVSDKMLILVVGDKSVIYPGLLKLGFDIVELDANGNPLEAPADGKQNSKLEDDNAIRQHPTGGKTPFKGTKDQSQSPPR